MTTAYEEVILSLAENKMRLDINQQTLEDLLTVTLGITQTKTMQKHIALMVRLGYIKVARRGLGKEQMSYDIVGKRLKTVQALRDGDATSQVRTGAVPRH